jgi:ribosomal protein L29
MKIREIRLQSDTELAKLIDETRRKIAIGYVEIKTKDVKQVREIRNLKVDLARALTIQSERELAELEKSNG